MNPLVILLLIWIVFPLPCLQGQEYRHGEYEELDLYFSLLEAEKRDSTYHKALARWQDTRPTQKSEPYLPFTISHRKLAEEYRVVISMPEKNESDIKTKTDKLVSLAGKAAKKREPVLELEALRQAFMLAFWSNPQDFHKAFIISFMLEEKLPRVTEEQYQWKRRAWFRLGEAYYLFLDFGKSIQLLEKALSPAPLAFDDQANLDALKILGICHANRGEWALSDQYFRATLLSGDRVLDRPLYNAYAISHLGCNAMLTGQYDKAMAFSEAVWGTLRKTEDKGHLAGMCYCRGKSHLAKGDFREAGHWVDSLLLFTQQDDYNKTKRIKQSYALRAEYSATAGDAPMAQAYNDTLIAIYKREEAQFTSQHITKASQDYHDSKLREKARMLKASRTQLALISLFALAAITVTVVITRLYRRNRAAYRSLVERAKEWASQDCPPDTMIKIDTGNTTGIKEMAEAHKTKKAPKTVEAPKTKDDPETEKHDKNGMSGEVPTAEDTEIMARIHREMTAGNAYRNPALTAELMAEQFGIHRNLLSRAVNRSTGSNFNQYVNSFRVKEAVRIMSEKKPQLYLDEISEQVGFNSRTSFYRAFKQKTGLSPREFQQNG